MNNKPTYLDNAATTPIASKVKEAMLPYFDEIYGNASSNHIYGKEAKRAIEAARGQVSKILNADPKEIYFTSGATEAINWALKGYLEANSEKGNHIITVKTEHKAVLKTCEYLETKGYEVTYLDVDSNGLISIDDLKSSIRENTAMIAVMYVNNEIGVIQDIKAIGELANENDVCFFCDATQAVGKIPVDVVASNIDLLCLSAHKMKGPKGIGALYIKRGINIEPLIHGGEQENGLRGGTYNTPLIVGLGTACEISMKEIESSSNIMTEQKARWIKILQNYGTPLFQNIETAPHILSIQLNEFEAEEFLMMKSREFVASNGSACNASIIEESHVTKALKLPPNRTIRISF